MRVEPLDVAAAAAAASAIGRCVQTLLGPSATLKAVIEDEDGGGTLTADVPTLVGALRVQHPVGTILEELCVAQAEEVGSGLTTLVALFGNLALAARDLIHLGVGVEGVLDGFECCADTCALTLRVIRVPSTALVELDGSGEGRAREEPLLQSSEIPPIPLELLQAMGLGGAHAAALLGGSGAVPAAGLAGADGDDEFAWFFEGGGDGGALQPLPPPEPALPPPPQRSPAVAPVGPDALDELGVLAASLAHGRGKEMSLAAAAAHAVRLADTRTSLHPDAEAARADADERISRVRVSRLVGHPAEHSTVLPAAVLLELERADADAVALALSELARGKGGGRRDCGARAREAGAFERAQPPGVSALCSSAQLLPVLIDDDACHASFRPHTSSAAARPGAARHVMLGAREFRSAAVRAEAVQDEYARAFVRALDAVCARAPRGGGGGNDGGGGETRALVLVRGGASVELAERCRAAGHVLVPSVHGTELRAVAALAGVRLSTAMAADEGSVVDGEAAWPGGGRLPARLLRAELWREGWTPDEEARVVRARRDVARAGHDSSWRLLLRAQLSEQQPPTDRAGAADASQAVGRRPVERARQAAEAGLPCTAVLRASSSAAAADAELVLRKCLCRLRNAILAAPPAGAQPASLAAVLPGGGASDVACMCALAESAERARFAAAEPLLREEEGGGGRREGGGREGSMRASSARRAKARLLEQALVFDAFAQALESTAASALVNSGLSPVVALDAIAHARALWGASCGGGLGLGLAPPSLAEMLRCAPISEALRPEREASGQVSETAVCDDPVAREAAVRNAVAAVRLTLGSDAIVSLHL